MSAVETITVEPVATITLRPAEAEAPTKTEGPKESQAKQDDDYRYTHYLPVWVSDKFPPLEPFEHSDPGARALSHTHPRSFLDNATSVVKITPNLGTEISGVALNKLSSDERDQLALEVSRSHLASTIILIVGTMFRWLDVDSSSSAIKRLSLTVDPRLSRNGVAILVGKLACHL